ncbi:MAG: hypothetical protein HYX75_02730 [Acidobacteria bacterium]|nr:hypothetical protein [Acidobacteriota bacterium]
MRRLRVLVIVLSALGAQAVSAAGSADEAARRGRSVREIKRVLRSSGFFDGTVIQGSGSYGGAYGSSSAARAVAAEDDATLPVAWGRKWDDVSKTYTITVDGDTATAVVNVSNEGTLYVDLSDDGVKNPGTRSFSTKMSRTATLSKDSNGKWKIESISVGVAGLADSSAQTVNVTSVTVDSSLSITDPTSEIDVDDILEAAPGEEIVVEATASNSTSSGLSPTTFVFLHSGPGYHRTQMTDDGTGADRAAGDGVYTASFTVPEGADYGRAHLAVDAIDSQTLQSESGPDYNWSVWLIGYRVD